MEERGVEVDHSTLNRWVLKVCAAAGAGLSRAEASGGWQLANGRDLYADQGPVEVSVSGGRQGRKHSRFPSACEAGSQGCFALLIPGDRPTWHTGEDYHRQEWRQHRSDRELQRGALSLLQIAKDRTRKYGTDWSDGLAVREYAKSMIAPGIKKVLNEHYFDHPLTGIPDTAFDHRTRTRRNTSLEEDVTIDDDLDFDLES
jgi:hypothetical protein